METIDINDLDTAIGGARGYLASYRPRQSYITYAPSYSNSWPVTIQPRTVPTFSTPLAVSY